jgi:hypothetical protein
MAAVATRRPMVRDPSNQQAINPRQGFAQPREIPNPKSQIPTNFQFGIPQLTGIWALGFLWDSGFGI